MNLNQSVTEQSNQEAKHRFLFSVFSTLIKQRRAHNQKPKKNKKTNASGELCRALTPAKEQSFYAWWSRIQSAISLERER